MDTATISHIVVDAHRERAWTLRNKTDVAAHFREFAAASLENVIASEIHLSIHLQTFHAVVQSVEGTEKRRLAATGRTDDASNLSLRNTYIYIFQDLCTIDIYIQVLGVELCMIVVNKLCRHI